MNEALQSGDYNSSEQVLRSTLSRRVVAPGLEVTAVTAAIHGVYLCSHDGARG